VWISFRSIASTSLRARLLVLFTALPGHIQPLAASRSSCRRDATDSWENCRYGRGR
jgi:hypothetical protein